VDVVGPDAIVDLRAGQIGATAIQILWSAPADNGPSGQASAYELRMAQTPITEQNFASATLLVAPAPGSPGSPEDLQITDLSESQTYYVAIRSTDDAGNRSALSNVPAITTAGDAPARVADLRVTVLTDSSVVLAWTAVADPSSGRPARYILRAAEQPLDPVVYANAAYERAHVATVDAGGTESQLCDALASAHRYWFGLKAIDTSGNASPLSNVVMVQTPVGGPIAGRSGIALAIGRQPTRLPISFYWQAAPGGEGGEQIIRVYDLSGRMRKAIGVGAGLGGVVQWDGRDARGERLPAGVYFARLVSGSFHAQTRIVLLP
jgi:hypothetical protein